MKTDTGRHLPPPLLVIGARASASKPLCGRKILLVEDEMLVLMDTQDMLEDLGCSAVVSAANVAEGLACIEAEVFDVALLDLNLNGDRSYAVADSLVAHGVPFAFATGYGAKGLRPQDGEHPVLMKPYPKSDLAKTLAALLVR
jgi:CheY-like chemotaxis protein